MSAAPRRRYATRLPRRQRREQLLDATLRLVTHEGFARVSVDAVAREAGVTRPVVYSLFEDLPALLRALVEREEDRALTQLARAIPRIPDAGDDPDDLLAESVRLFLEAVHESPRTWRLIVLPPLGAPAEVRERVEANRTAIVRQVERLVAWGVERRGGPAGIDTELLARTIAGVAEEGARLTLTDPHTYPVERLVRYVRQLAGALQRGEAGGGAPTPPAVELPLREAPHRPPPD